MENKTIYQKVFAIHDQVMGVLRSMQIPPYPAHYKKFFEGVFLEMADAELRKDLESAEHKLVSNSKDDTTKCLDIAKRSVISFVESHADISSVAQMQQQYIDGVPPATLESYISFIEGLNALNKTMSDELEKAQSKITTLTTDLQEALASLSTDQLTKVGNRKGFMDDMESAIEAGKNKKISLVLMMIDIDNFKFINEEHGHLAGDKVLYFMAQSIKTMIRSVDKVYRYGGEEFAVVISRCDETKAYAIADKIRSKIEQSNLIYSGKQVYLTVSVGVTIHQKGDSLEDIIGRAEKALYCAKKSSKNCTISLDY